MTEKGLRNRSARLIRLPCSWAAFKCSLQWTLKSSTTILLRIHQYSVQKCMGMGSESAPSSTLQKLREGSYVCGDDQVTQGAHTGSSLPTARQEGSSKTGKGTHKQKSNHMTTEKVSCQRTTVPLGSDSSVLFWLKSLLRKAWKIMYLFGWGRQKRTVGNEAGEVNSLKRLLSRLEEKWDDISKKKVCIWKEKIKDSALFDILKYIITKDE